MAKSSEAACFMMRTLMYFTYLSASRESEKSIARFSKVLTPAMANSKPTHHQK